MNPIKNSYSIKYIKRLQHFFKNRLHIQNKFNCERMFLYNIIEEMSTKLLQFYSQHSISVEYYKKYMIRNKPINKVVDTSGAGDGYNAAYLSNFII